MSLAAALPRLDVAGGTVIPLSKARAGSFLGKGRIDELAGSFKSEGIELVFIGGPVTPVQQRNLEKAWEIKILDRTGLILEIFSARARTREGVLQVEMAALSYQRTRLVRAWTHLERQRGGLGFVGGPGETQLEADRRAIDAQLSRLKKQLAKVAQTRELHRAARKRVTFPVVALVGYTNAGKSTLFNRLTGARVRAEDMLFATLDPTMRAIRLPDGRTVILADTVGFISDLPTQLVAAFRATLEDVLEADLICHVRDVSHPETERQAEDVRGILGQLGATGTVPMIEACNKIDRLDPEARAALRAREQHAGDIFAISARAGTGVSGLLNTIARRLEEPVLVENLRLDFGDGRKRAWLFRQNVVKSETQDTAGYRITVRWSARQRALFDQI